MAFVTQAELASALNPGTFLTLFDDNNVGIVVDPSPAVALVLQRAHAEVLSYLGRIYDTVPAELPAVVSILLKSAELDYAIALSFDRHPEFAKSFGDAYRDHIWKRAETKMERIADSVQQIDSPPAPRPNNVGGLLLDGGPRTLVLNSDGTSNTGDF